ncbi:prevent-host-death protein [Variovorax sp. J22P271]|uniref:prevent-host-death protein n=1 Tax=Variovorax davisae TaxID=3053515 RepID=UPI0025771CF4|nr:prevent-host-death protein [Variovorax sp. J22P271]MDM0031727.1 prevent-host-death protein [Variovorax sp. J22P271]
MQISTTEARSQFDCLGQAAREPETLALAKSTDAGQHEFNETCWIAAQNALPERIGVFGEVLRPWQTLHGPGQ